jgi:adenylate cyclase
VPRLSIIVLPFANLSDDPKQEYFADGITDDLTTDLSRISESFVIARNTAFTYKGKPVDVKEIGRELGVRYVLEGSVRRTGEQVRVNVQLIDTGSGAHIWADRFDTDRADLAEAQDEITGRLARTLNLELVADVGRRIEREQTRNPDVRDLVMRGWAWFYQPRSPSTVEEALTAFERALSVDPQSIDAKIGIATILVTDLTGGLNRSLQDEARAERLLLEALEHDTNHSMAHYAMGVLRRSQNRLTESRLELEAAVALDRNNARALHQLGHTLRYLGEPDAAIPHIEKAIRLNPRDPFVAHYYYALGSCHLFLGHVDLALELLTRARAGNPRYWYIHLWLAAALGLRGDLAEAKAALAEGIKLEPRVSSLAQWRAHSRWGTPKHTALAEATVYAGLRRAGFPDK